MKRKCICDEFGTVCLKHKAKQNPNIKKNLKLIAKLAKELDNLVNNNQGKDNE